MKLNIGTCICLLVVAGGLFYVGYELHQMRKAQEANLVYNHVKNKTAKAEWDNRTQAGFKSPTIQA